MSKHRWLTQGNTLRRKWIDTSKSLLPPLIQSNCFDIIPSYSSRGWGMGECVCVCVSVCACVCDHACVCACVWMCACLSECVCACVRGCAWWGDCFQCWYRTGTKIINKEQKTGALHVTYSCLLLHMLLRARCIIYFKHCKSLRLGKQRHLLSVLYLLHNCFFVYIAGLNCYAASRKTKIGKD